MELIKDLNNLTSIPEKTLEKLSNNIMFSILQSLEETLLENESICEINMNIATLLISLEDNELRFKFIPSKEFEKEIVKTIKNKKNSMEAILTSNMVTTLEKTYKELL